ncbi:MAG TPA: trigger factor [Verrucomicrobiales bacterium]|nr:trigger factor [Verrucomicrobiales bacterium]
MNVTIENVAPCKRLLRIEVPAQEVDTAFNNTAQEFQKQVRLPGFRPGKAPRAMVLKKFEPDILAEVKRRLVPDIYRKALKENKLSAVGYPEIEEVQFGKGVPLMFNATVEIAPDFSLPEYKGLAARAARNEVSEEDVEKALGILRDRQAKYETVDREAKEGDIAVVNYTGTCEGKPIIETAPTAKGLTEQKNFWVNIAKDSFIPGFSEQLVGAKKGDKRTVTVTFPPDFVTAALAGKEGVFDVDVAEVKERSLPAIDQAFAESYGAESPEKLREGVREDLANELKSKRSRDIRNQVIKQLLDAVTFELPEGVVSAETRNVVYQIVQENQQRGVGKEAIEQQKDQIYSAATAGAKERVKAAFIFRKIAEKENIKVEQQELNMRVHLMAQQYQIPVEKFVKDLEKRGGVSEVYDQLMNEKVIKFLEENAKIEEVDPQELAAAEAAAAGAKA